VADAVDTATELVAHHQAEALARHRAEAERARRIDESMRPRDPATEGTCLDCSAEIDPRRRALMPTTNRCTECASVAETLYRETAWMPR
jgi:RNA polymerase-binding transcription factor DksA